MNPNELAASSLFYTFSTIAQVLAGFIALSGVFVIFKIQEFKRLQKSNCEAFLFLLSLIEGLKFNSYFQCAGIATRLKNLLDIGITNGIITEMEEILANELVAKSKEKSKLLSIKKMTSAINARKNLIISLTSVSAIVGSIVIVYSILVLFTAPTDAIRFHFNICVIGLLITISLMIVVILMSLIEVNTRKLYHKKETRIEVENINKP